MLQKHKFRRPKYMNVPGSLCDDPRWIKLSPEAAKALVTILLIAGKPGQQSAKSRNVAPATSGDFVLLQKGPDSRDAHFLEPIDPFALLFRSGRLLATIEPDFNTLLK